MRGCAAATSAVGAAAMLDAMLGPHLVPSLAWAAVLVALALLTALHVRLDAAPTSRTASSAPPAVHHHGPTDHADEVVFRRGAALHGALGALLMAALLVRGDHAALPAAAGAVATASAHAHPAPAYTVLLTVAVIVFCAFTAVVAVRLAQRRAWPSLVESCTMAAAAAFMLSFHA
jgi:hypothetical protein